jgi:CDP-glucose 4,6-dehydratase
MIKGFDNIYQDKKVFITGHTGFKGSWMALWLSQLGAQVTGYSLEPPTRPNHFDLLDMDIKTVIGDLNESKYLTETMQECQPDIVFHMAAQSLVRESYRYPKETFHTNVMGTVSVFEAVRVTDSVRAIVNVTSDKCYENKERKGGYLEYDPLGGNDPYSASKACAEIVTTAYRRSYFPIGNYRQSHQVLLASVRAGNVIGGGDWANDRLIPDIVQAVISGETLHVRYPEATRPWQHVLEPLGAYLLLGKQLLEGDTSCAHAWNIGPVYKDAIKVRDIINMVKAQWQDFEVKEIAADNLMPEAQNLTLDCSKAKRELPWRPRWDTAQAIEQTIAWYKAYYQEQQVLSLEQLDEYTR